LPEAAAAISAMRGMAAAKGQERRRHFASRCNVADMLEDLLGDYNVELFGYYMLRNIELWVLKRSIQPAAAPVPAARRRIRLRSAFMNESVVGWCQARGLEVMRSRMQLL
jgi:hypothetical protein